MNITIEVHSKSGCPFCIKAKAFLDEHGLPFEEFVHDDDQQRQAFYDHLDLRGRDRTLPQVLIVDRDGERMRIGGYQSLISSGIASLHRL